MLVEGCGWHLALCKEVGDKLNLWADFMPVFMVMLLEGKVE